MKHRFTVKNLQKKDDPAYLDDLKLLRAVISDRQGDCSNVYSPLYQRLQELYRKIDKKINNGETEL